MGHADLDARRVPAGSERFRWSARAARPRCGRWSSPRLDRAAPNAARIGALLGGPTALVSAAGSAAVETRFAASIQRLARPAIRPRTPNMAGSRSGLPGPNDQARLYAGLPSCGHIQTRTGDLLRVKTGSVVRKVAICRDFAGEAGSAYARICGVWCGIRPRGEGSWPDWGGRSDLAPRRVTAPGLVGDQAGGASSERAVTRNAPEATNPTRATAIRIASSASASECATCFVVP